MKLEERGLIRKLPQIVAGKGQTYNDYRLNIAGLPSWANEKKGNYVLDSPGGKDAGPD